MRASSFLRLMPFVLCVIPLTGQAQTSIDDRCHNATAGVVQGMQLQREIGQSREVALEAFGYAPGGPNYRIADFAYRQLEAGVPMARILDEARAQCRKLGPLPFEEEVPTFKTTREADGRGGGAQLCADVANSISGILADEPAMRSMSTDDALEFYLRSAPRDFPTPQLRELLALALKNSSVRFDEQEVEQQLYRRCDALPTKDREALDREFYAP